MTQTVAQKVNLGNDFSVVYRANDPVLAKSLEYIDSCFARGMDRDSIWNDRHRSSAAGGIEGETRHIMRHHLGVPYMRGETDDLSDLIAFKDEQVVKMREIKALMRDQYYIEFIDKDIERLDLIVEMIRTRGEKKCLLDYDGDPLTDPRVQTAFTWGETPIEDRKYCYGGYYESIVPFPSRLKSGQPEPVEA